jgi:predicted nucleotidyltransferase
MTKLSPNQHELVMSLANQLGQISAIKAIVLGGSHARGRAQPASDIDLGILYSEVAPFSIESIREMAAAG